MKVGDLVKPIRRLDDLEPELKALAQRHCVECLDNDIRLLIYETYRPLKRQHCLYAQGRRFGELPSEVRATVLELWPGDDTLPERFPGPIVTWSYNDSSPHTRRRAYDCVPIIDNRAVWEDELVWALVGRLGKDLGLHWGGDWKERDMPHFQLP